LRKRKPSVELRQQAHEEILGGILSPMSRSWQSLLQAKVLTKESLRESSRLALEESTAVASAAAVPGDPLGLEVRTKQGKTLTVLVDNLFADASRAAPDVREHLVSQFIAAIVDSGEAGQQRSLDQVVPLIKSAQWVEGLPASAKDLASDRLVADLYVVYAFDEASTMEYVRWPELAEFGQPRMELAGKALANLRARLPLQLGRRGNEKCFHLIANGNHEASLILLDEVWEQLRSSISDDIVVCVPARDICLVSATGIPGGIESLVAARDRLCAGTPSNFISKTLLRRRGKEWIPFQEPS
jgi:uncharacterized protein YtpQ (UPF0354 family)